MIAEAVPDNNVSTGDHESATLTKQRQYNIEGDGTMKRKLLALSVGGAFGLQSMAIPQWRQVMEIVL